MKNVSLRLDEKDYKILDTNAKVLEVSKNEFVRNLIRLSSIKNIEEFNSNLKELLILKRALSNNINQLAKKGHKIDNFEEIREELEELWQSLKR
ncbi:ribbon-helix-helix protein, CopG family [uncultured Cetobacterium sp.]|uniref:ribbon-helix-helix protein, CopG family n=1 Tax=uncultured Cetobacterium sp. TaxID=527638 RepID=UPI0026039F37|nr:ribbon-helix-helix protein, CopG family [uncultured Cetobacterium sp.]